ncbi:PREDICTED: LOW QUALITY PROTEIN: glutamate receptor ionotropic, kainate 3-like [Priapulus caudatus]|uniref:LOW QUALITY PROTEIN: glutamate receptor ionotropic, kainate 3-like n=1 Tax=Priapulus caudatus TaxID=37621 RepID=A0ABM1EHE6_PRICU|nr:PREDICTED: LOW QUALITY PROTEIN: glutamate receptor ionotropic, kainate 3-like [Priapulus caudatus]
MRNVKMTSTFLVFLSVFLSIPCSSGRQKQQVRIGALFDNGDETMIEVFKIATQHASLSNTMFTFVPIVDTSIAGDSFVASQKACKILKMGVVAMFGPQSLSSSALVRSICDTMEMPHLSTELSYGVRGEEYSIRLYPDQDTLSNVYTELISSWQWKNFTVIYDGAEGLVRVKHILALPGKMLDKRSKSATMQITVRQLEGSDYQPLLKEIRQRGDQQIVIDCDASKIARIMNDAKKMKMVTQYYHYYFTSLDMTTVKLDKSIQRSGANITFLRLINPDSRALSRRYDFHTLGDILTRGGRQPLHIGYWNSVGNLTVTKTKKDRTEDTLAFLNGTTLKVTSIEKADLAVAPLTITAQREDDVDFTKPFMTLGISILFKKPKQKDPELFGFLRPLALDVWVYVIVAYLGVSLLLFVLARFSPYEWYNPHPCNRNSDLIENQFTVMNSLWFTIGSLMQQGCEIMPRATSTRLASGIWWFFTLVIISSYTANLAAFLTVARMVTPIENADDLAGQTDIKYGCVASGSTQNFFRESKIPTYERMWAFMNSNPDVFVNSSTTGMEKVRREKYAYLMESTMVEYNILRDCSLQQVGGLLDSKGYGIGTPRNSRMRDILSSIILNLTEESQFHIIKDRWWKEKAGTQCQAIETKKDEASSLDTSTLGGVFVALLGGTIVAMVMGVVEFLWKRRQQAYIEQDPFCIAVIDQLLFAANWCTGDKPPPAAPLRRKAAQDRYVEAPGFHPNSLQPYGLDNYSNHASVHVPPMPQRDFR